LKKIPPNSFLGEGLFEKSPSPNPTSKTFIAGRKWAQLQGHCTTHRAVRRRVAFLLPSFLFSRKEKKVKKVFPNLPFTAKKRPFNVKILLRASFLPYFHWG
jgi:hypothetical protein